jgi:hypothetical protein
MMVSVEFVVRAATQHDQGTSQMPFPVEVSLIHEAERQPGRTLPMDLRVWEKTKPNARKGSLIPAELRPAPQARERSRGYNVCANHSGATP